MKDYPSIPGAIGQQFSEIPNAYIFDKLDGRQVRVEWNRKHGFHKWGSRHHLIDILSDPDYGHAAKPFSKFNRTLHDFLVKRWQKATLYFELWQEHSLGGVFVPNETYNLTLFDVAPDHEGIIGPKRFLQLFPAVAPTPTFLGQDNFTRGFADKVRAGYALGVTFEGVVAKAGDGHKQQRGKAKTQKWIDAIIARHGEVEGKRIIES